MSVGPKSKTLLQRLRMALGSCAQGLSDDDLLSEGLSLLLQDVVEALETDSIEELGRWLASGAGR